MNLYNIYCNVKNNMKNKKISKKNKINKKRKSKVIVVEEDLNKDLKEEDLKEEDLKEDLKENVSPRNCVNMFHYKSPLIAPMILNSICNLKEPVNKKTIPGSYCKTCGKIFIGHKHGFRLLQHCDSLNHRYY